MLKLITILAIAVTSLSLDAQSTIPDGETADPIERMPTFISDCPEDKDHKACSDRAMLEFVYSNIGYPAKAVKRGVEGMAVVTFVIERDGTVSNIKILRDPGAGTGKELERIVNAMNDNGPSWRPGIQGGELVRVQFNLPVKFSLGEKGN
ncbi:energy transducer TonB [Neolewinella sp.]|uniref:energy transducer TonB n=1 Tax=Neolewinella sp. TaxID=2993543 RepID=UPI003B51B84C